VDEEEVDRDEGAVEQDCSVEGEAEPEFGFDEVEVLQEWKEEHEVVSQESEVLHEGVLRERFEQPVDEVEGIPRRTMQLKMTKPGGQGTPLTRPTDPEHYGTGGQNRANEQVGEIGAGEGAARGSDFTY